jgi:Protein of unknown function (DUF3574)
MNNNLYRLYLGLDSKSGPVSDQSLETFLRVNVLSRIAGFTVFRALGYWESKAENSAIVEVLGDDSARAQLGDIAREYCSLFDQDCTLLLTSSVSDSAFISRERIAA